MANAYLLKDGAGDAGAVIDPGGDGRRIIERCAEAGLKPQFIINTHGHFDPVGANAALKAAFPEARLCIGKADASALRKPSRRLLAALPEWKAGPTADVLLEDGAELRFGVSALTVLATPGHTPGSVCLLSSGEAPPQLFCGDLIFHGDVGRTDLPGGSQEQLLASIREKVLTLPDETVLWPGHGEETTVGEERRHNEFLQPDVRSIQ